MCACSFCRMTRLSSGRHSVACFKAADLTFSTNDMTYHWHHTTFTKLKLSRRLYTSDVISQSINQSINLYRAIVQRRVLQCGYAESKRNVLRRILNVMMMMMMMMQMAWLVAWCSGRSCSRAARNSNTGTAWRPTSTNRSSSGTTFSRMPNPDDRRVSSMLWSVVSKAAERSIRQRQDTICEPIAL